jgi:hypothetical protein
MSNECFYCKISEKEIPLIRLAYRDEILFICPQHLPMLIHKPEQLAEILSGSEGTNPEQE